MTDLNMNDKSKNNDFHNDHKRKRNLKKKQEINMSKTQFFLSI